MPTDDTVDLWQEHAKAFAIFADCETQWRIIAGMAGAVYQGLDYPAVESVMRMHGVEDTVTCLRQIRSLERGALEGLNAK